MTTRVILVRAVNVGGTARLPMAEFRAMLEGLGATNARTYIASGNALVDITDDGPEACAQFDRSVERELDARFGFQRDVFSRSVDELQAALEEHPFAIDEPKWSYVSFLSAEPAQTALTEAQELTASDAEWSVIGSHLHLRYPNGMSNTTLNIDALMRQLGVVGTARNLRTVQSIIDLSRR